MEKTVKSKELTIDMTGKRENEIPENTTIEFETKPDDPPDIASLKITDSYGHVKIKHGDTIKDKISVRYNKQKKGYTFPTKFQNKKYKIYVDDTYSSSEKKVNFEIQTNNNQLVGEIKLTNIGTTAADTNTAASGADTNTAGAATNTAAPVVSATQAPVAASQAPTPVAASQAPTPVAGATLGATKVAEMLKEIKIGQFTIEGFDNNNIVINDDTLDNLFKIKDGNVTIDNNKVNEFFTTAEDNLEVSVIKKNAQGGFDGIQKMNFGILKTIQGINITTINDLKEPIELSPEQLSNITQTQLAAANIQTAFRGFQAKQILKKKTAEKKTTEKEAATKIQSMAKRKKAQNELKAKKMEKKIEDIFKDFSTRFGNINDNSFKKKDFEDDFVKPILEQSPINLKNNVKTAIERLVAALNPGQQSEPNKIQQDKLVELKAALNNYKDNYQFPDLIKGTITIQSSDYYGEKTIDILDNYEREEKIKNIISAKALEEGLRLFLEGDDDNKIKEEKIGLFNNIYKKENFKDDFKKIIEGLLKTIKELSKPDASIVLKRKPEGDTNSGTPTDTNSGTEIPVGANGSSGTETPQQQGENSTVTGTLAQNLGTQGIPGGGGKRTKRRRSKRVATKKK